jgi:hypothetical protein
MIQGRRLPKSLYRDHVSNMESIDRAQHLVYILWCPLDKTIKYVGYTDSMPWTRLSLHVCDGRKNNPHPRYQWMKRLLAAGLIPTMRLMKSFPDKGAAYRYEAALIASIGTKRELTNRYPGNPNWKPSPGWVCSPGKEPYYEGGTLGIIPPLPWILGGPVPA